MPFCIRPNFDHGLRGNAFKGKPEVSGSRTGEETFA